MESWAFDPVPTPSGLVLDGNALKFQRPKAYNGLPKRAYLRVPSCVASNVEADGCRVGPPDELPAAAAPSTFVGGGLGWGDAGPSS
jgi:hypothetical protein